jgi:transcriptional regulator GlxA family with amidase domain
MRYLADWRLFKARALLAELSLTVGEFARAVGYESEASFNRAFSRHFEKTPGTVRKSINGKVRARACHEQYNQAHLRAGR